MSVILILRPECICIECVSLTLFKLYSSINIDPLLGSINFNISENIVLLPAPEGPTKAIILPLFMSKLISSITLLS